MPSPSSHNHFNMPKKVSNWVTRARNRWPRSFTEKEIFGDGQYAVLMCPFMHPSAGRMMYSEVHLFDTREKAAQFKANMDAGRSGEYCHAQTKGLCSGDHELVDLAAV
jgi:hypothetical protein